MTEFSDLVEAYIQYDRQWKRDYRIAHAKRELARATTDEGRNFWRAVLQRNED